MLEVKTDLNTDVKDYDSQTAPERENLQSLFYIIELWGFLVIILEITIQIKWFIYLS